MQYLRWWLVTINAFTFLIRGRDKWMARINGQRLEQSGHSRQTQQEVAPHKRIRTKTRISEKQLLFLTLLGGGAGALLGMSTRRHKTRKGSFLWKVFAIIVLQIVLIIWLLQ